MQVGTTEDQGLYNKPSAAVDPWALAAGTLPQYNNNTVIVRTVTLKGRYLEPLDRRILSHCFLSACLQSVANTDRKICP